MKRKVIKGFILLLLVFLLLFFGRWFVLIHFSKKVALETPGAVDYSVNLALGDKPLQFQGFEAALGNCDINIKKPSATFYAQRNYARETMFGATYKTVTDSRLSSVKQKPVLQPSKPQANEATYEKVGSLSAWTRDFDNDEKKIRAILKTNQVLVQQEENSGLKGSRSLSLALGVVPEKFDQVIEEMKKVGNLASFRVTKTDKTNEYKALMAQRAAIEKNKADLVALKNRGGKMSEMVGLQERIFQIEKTLGDLGLQIGKFEGQTSLCTIVAALAEAGPAPALWVFAPPAFHWAVGELFSLLFYFLFMCLAICALVWAVEKGKSFPQLVRSKLAGGKGEKS